MNQINLIGRIGKEPEAKETEGGKTITRTTLAVSNSKEHTEWFNIVAWENAAKTISKYAHKGDIIQLTGRVETREYEKDGDKKRITEVVVSQVELLPNKRNEVDPAPAHKQPGMDKDDLPF